MNFQLLQPQHHGFVHSPFIIISTDFITDCPRGAGHRWREAARASHNERKHLPYPLTPSMPEVILLYSELLNTTIIFTQRYWLAHTLNEGFV